MARVQRLIIYFMIYFLVLYDEFTRVKLYWCWLFLIEIRLKWENPWWRHRIPQKAHLLFFYNFLQYSLFSLSNVFFHALQFNNIPSLLFVHPFSLSSSIHYSHSYSFIHSSCSLVTPRQWLIFFPKSCTSRHDRDSSLFNNVSAYIILYHHIYIIQ